MHDAGRAGRAAGLDGCRGGWLAIVLADGCFERAAVYPDYATAAAHLHDVAWVGVDMPIGLVDSGFREADVAARRAAGRAVASVFRTPPRPAVEASSYAEANTEAVTRTGKGLSRQAWSLRGKILELDVLQPLDDQVVEVHPEVAFRTLAGRDLPSKRTWTGLAERLELLHAVGIDVPSHPVGGERAGPDDVVDAAVVAWVAAGFSPRRRGPGGGVFSLPDVPQQFDAGRPILIWARRA